MSYEAQQVCFYEYDQQLKDLANGVTITSCVVSSISFLLKCFDSQSFVFPGRLATAATFLSVLFSFTLLITTVTDFKNLDPTSDKSHQDLCTAQGIIFQFLAVSITIHWTFICLVTYLVVVVRYPLRNFVKLERYFNIFCWSLAVALTFIPIALRGDLDVYGPNSAITSCYFQHINDQFYWFYLNMMINLAVGTYLTARIVARLFLLARSEDFFAGRKFKIRSCLIRWCMAVRACCCNDHIEQGTKEGESPTGQTSDSFEEENQSDGYSGGGGGGGGGGGCGGGGSYLEGSITSPLSGDYDSDYGQSDEYGQVGVSSASSLRHQREGRRSNSRASQHSVTSKSSKHVLATVMRYHLLRHVLFMLLFMFVFITTFLDAINRKISARKSHGSIDPQDTLDHRFTKQHPCATAFVAIFSSSGVGLLVGLAFLRRPNCFKGSPVGGQPSNRPLGQMISIPEKDHDDEEKVEENKDDDGLDYYCRKSDDEG